MAGNGELRTARAATVRPGALTELLLEIAAPPAAAGGAGGPGGPAGPSGPDGPNEEVLSRGERVGRFEILREVGRGGFGVVYEARDTELGRSVALKLIRRARVQEFKADRLLAEAEAAARLAHPNLCHLYDVGRCQRGPYLVMELLRGETLDERLGRGRLLPREALRVAVEMASGLSHAHAQGVVHRDLKPGNVFLCRDGQVKLLDFGLAHVFGRAGLAGGTPAYMAPEQASGETGDERVDVYALGVVLYELLAGKLPYDPRGERGVEPGGRGPEIPGAPAALQGIVDRMLARDPAERPGDGAEAHALLAAFQKTLEPRRRAWLAWALTAVAVSAAVRFWLVGERPLPPGRLLTAIADTDNATGDPELDSVSERFRVGLEQSKRVAIMARSRLIGLPGGRGATGPRVIGEAQARDAAKNARAQLLVVPAVRRVGSGYEVSVRGLNLERGEPIFQSGLSEQAGGKGSIPDALDRLVLRVRKQLHEDPQGQARNEEPARKVPPANPEAWRLFDEGRRADSEGRDDDALKTYQQAIAADPAFLLPRLALLDLDAFADRTRLTPEERAAHAGILQAGLDRLPAKERAYADFLLVEQDEAAAPGDLLALVDRAIQAAPEDPRAYAAAIVPRLYNRSDLAAARPYMEKYIAIAPPRDLRVPDLLMALGALDEALAWVRGWTEEPRPESFFGNLYMVHRARGEVPEALEAARHATALDPGHARAVRWAFVDADALEEEESHFARSGDDAWRMGWLRLRGRVREAIALSDTRAPSGDRPDGAHFGWHAFRSFLFAQRGDVAAAHREVQEALAFGVAEGPFHCAAWRLALLGDEVGARRLASVSSAWNHTGCMRLYRAIRTWKAGDRDAALGQFAAIHLAAARLYRGEILAELGRDREAVEAFRLSRRGVTPAGSVTWDWLVEDENYPRSLYLEAAALERLGERDEARRVVARLLHLWERADADLPLLAEARALEARLAAGSR